MSGGKEDVPLARSELFDLHEAPIELLVLQLSKDWVARSCRSVCRRGMYSRIRVLVRPICIDYEIVRALGTNKHLQEMI